MYSGQNVFIYDEKREMNTRGGEGEGRRKGEGRRGGGRRLKEVRREGGER